MNDQERERIIDYLKGNEFFHTIKDIDRKVASWLDAYPINILAELKKANAWLVCKGYRYRNYARFINGWLARSAGAPITRPPSLKEVMARVSEEVDMKVGLGKNMTPRKQATIEELKKQAEILMEREKKQS